MEDAGNVCHRRKAVSLVSEYQCFPSRRADGEKQLFSLCLEPQREAALCLPPRGQTGQVSPLLSSLAGPTMFSGTASEATVMTPGWC